MAEDVNAFSLAMEYRAQCSYTRCKVNSGVLRALETFDTSKDPLIEFDLSGNYVGRTGVVPVILAIKKVPTLARLNLSSNYLNNDSVKELCAALHGHTSLQYIDLSSNPISHSSGKQIRAFLQRNANVLCVSVNNTLMNPALRRIIERNGLENSRLNSAASDRSKMTNITAASSLKRHLGDATGEALLPTSACSTTDCIPRYGIELLSRNVSHLVDEKYQGIRTLQAAAALICASSPKISTDLSKGPDQWYALELVWKVAASQSQQTASSGPEPQVLDATARSTRSSSPALGGLANVMAVVRNDERLVSNDSV